MTTIHNRTTLGGGLASGHASHAYATSGVVIKPTTQQTAIPKCLGVALLSVMLVAVMLGVVSTPNADAQVGLPWDQIGADVMGRANAVAMSGDGTTMVVGDSATEDVRVYRQDGDNWQQLGNTISEGSRLFGNSVAIDDDGDTIVVGSRGPGGISPVSWVYGFDGAGWNEITNNVLSNNTGTNGAKVDISGDGTVVAVSRRLNSTVDQLVVFRIDGSGNLVEIGDPLTTGSNVTDVSLSQSGKAVAVSSGSGGTQVYRLSPLGNDWNQVNGNLPSTGVVEINNFASIAVIGLPVSNVARVYRDIGGSWVLGSNLVGEVASDGSGAALAMSNDGSVVAVGAPGNSQAGPNAGHVRIYELQGALWQQSVPDIDGQAGAELTGWALGMNGDGTRIVVGAPGQARVFGPPEVRSDMVSILAAESVLIDVRANDGFPSGAMAVLTQPAQGVATVENNQIRYEPGISTSVTDSFDYELCDLGVCDSATVSISITPPTCQGQALAPSFATIWGTHGPDTISTGASDDVIVAFGGDDVIDTGDGANTVCAGDGDDVVTAGTGDDFLTGGDGDDLVTGGTGDDFLAGGDGVDFLFGGEGSDTMNGGIGNDRIRGQQGVDVIDGGAGNDFLYGGVDGDTITGGPGNDTIGGFGGADLIDAGPGNDRVFGGFGPDNINAGPGDDTVLGLVGNDVINGGDGDDALNGDNGQDIINGGPGNDVIKGGNSLDTLFGDAGDDNVSGGKSDDSLSGGAGNDTCSGNTEAVADTADTTCETIFGVP